MRLFACSRCGNLLSFENVSCTVCAAQLGFLLRGTPTPALSPAGSPTA